MAAVALPSRASIEETRKREAARRAANAGYPDVEMLSDRFDKEIDERVDIGNDDDLDPITAPDPANDAIDRAGRKPGTAYKLLSKRVCDVLGMRGYQLATDAKGREITVGTMMLGEIPQRIADKRLKEAVRKSDEEVGLIADDYGATVDRLKHQAAGLGLRVLDKGEEIDANTSTDFGTLGDRRGSGVEIRRGA
jgi:hypothetical protein